MIELKPWTLPLIVAALAVPIVLGFFVAGPPLGLALGFLAIASLVVIAARQRPGGLIETAPTADARHRVLVVISRELEDPAAIAGLEELTEDDAEVRVVAPAQAGLLDRLATDVAGARAEAQRKLVVSVASLGKADVVSTAAVGDEDLVRAVEDQLRSFAANEVVLVTGTPDEDPDGDRAAAELKSRLAQPLTRILG